MCVLIEDCMKIQMGAGSEATSTAALVLAPEAALEAATEAAPEAGPKVGSEIVTDTVPEMYTSLQLRVGMKEWVARSKTRKSIVHAVTSHVKVQSPKIKI